MQNEVPLRRCFYCGRQFIPIHASSAFCSYGHYAMYMKGDVHIPEDAIVAPVQVGPFKRPHYGSAPVDPDMTERNHVESPNEIRRL